MIAIRVAALALRLAQCTCSAIVISIVTFLMSEAFKHPKGPNDDMALSAQLHHGHCLLLLGLVGLMDSLLHQCYPTLFLQPGFDNCMCRVVLLALQLLAGAQVPVSVVSAVWAGGVSSTRLHRAGRQGCSGLRADGCFFDVHELPLGLVGVLEEGSE